MPGAAVDEILFAHRKSVVEIVRETYLLHERGETINPDSYFLRFPEKPNARIIALPAKLGGPVEKAGIKWIASFPDNVERGIPRASAVLILNDFETGYPVACLESAGISAARTAASAATAAGALLPLINTTERPSISFVGAGVIARTILDYLVPSVVSPEAITVLDLDGASAEHFVAYAKRGNNVPARESKDLAEVLAGDVVVLATTAGKPYLPDHLEFRPGQLVLNVSLRDLHPATLLRAANIVDDIDHCLKADTSPHLAEQLSGGRDFITGTIGQVLLGKVRLDAGRPVVFSPFGLGVLDIAVGDFVLRTASAQNRTIPIPNFFGSTVRWGASPRPEEK
ncbi:2,3-diaminopropionate biosynthesis protein SbnB [Amycolatopsis taiwanensis]|uniref:2,3-diaminopropionate biosynthesis protein SbnB n=1 Tax=Amycolatopsis taiwanensis TaxID=342230 RepID=UPI002552BF09|nr:2,3-diaminopropionate biosynthesis protein SbnB [Amycolatopsis taiwanensis]